MDSYADTDLDIPTTLDDAIRQAGEAIAADLWQQALDEAQAA